MILAVLILPVAIGFTALAVEGGIWYADQHNLRSMADSAAMAAGWAARDGDDELTLATEAAEEMGFDASMDDIVVNSPPTMGEYEGDEDAFEVIITRSRPLLLSTLFLNRSTIDISVRAVARSTTRSAYCVLALSNSASNAINFSGGPNVTLDGCGINANSNSGSAINLAGNATLEADWAQSRGEIDVSNNATLETEIPKEENSVSRPDPFADLPTPTKPANCPTGNVTSFTPCTFSGGVSFGSHDVITLDPGTYYVDGEMRVNSGASVTGVGVTLYFTDDGFIRFNGNADFDITAPSTGTYAGMAMMQSRTAPSGVTNKINGGTDMNIQGAVYFPNQAIEFKGGASLGGGCTRIVANTVEFGGNAVMGNECEGLGLPETIADEPALVE